MHIKVFPLVKLKDDFLMSFVNVTVLENRNHTFEKVSCASSVNSG